MVDFIDEHGDGLVLGLVFVLYCWTFSPSCLVYDNTCFRNLNRHIVQTKYIVFIRLNQDMSSIIVDYTSN